MKNIKLEEIINNPTLVLSEFKAEEIVILKSTLVTSAKQILCKYGYMQLNDKGFDKYTKQQVIDRMPNEVRVMYWSINNASYLLALEHEFRTDQTQMIRQLRAELTMQQMKIIELQIKLKQK